MTDTITSAVDPTAACTGLPAVFRIGDWRIEVEANRISNGDREIKLEDKVMQVLCLLARHHQQPVSRETLEQSVWAGRVVGYDALTRCVAQLRKAFGDDSRQPRYIETISKKGYRLMAPLSLVGDDAPRIAPAPGGDANTQARSTRLPRVALAALLSIAAAAWLALNFLSLGNSNDKIATAASTIYIEPFSSLNDDPAQRLLSRGISADIVTGLSKVTDLKVAFDQEGAGHAPARYHLNGSVRNTGGTIRVNVNLIDSQDNRYLWSENYDRNDASLARVQDVITRQIIDALAVQLSQQEIQQLAKPYTENLEAYDDFLRGQHHYFRHTADDNLRARDYFQQAIDRDPVFARAFSALALTFVAQHRYAWGEQSPQLLNSALEMASTATLLDPNLPQAYWALGYVHLFQRDYAQAASAAEKAIALDPNFADAYLTLAICDIHRGDYNRAIGLIRHAMQINPEYPAAYASILGQAFFFNGQYRQALNPLRKSVERNPNLLTPRVLLAVSLKQLGLEEEASWEAEQIRMNDGGFSADHIDELVAVEDQRQLDMIRRQLVTLGL